jgi:hypothetical protein
MTLTRIKNNQITDSSIVASSKLQDNSITAGKLANNINYGSNLTITGNLTVNGTSTTLDTVNTLIEDPILLLAKDQTGSAALDIGFVGERGDDTNIAWIWDESADQFAAGFTSDDGSANTITLSSYADVRANDITAVGITLSGNVTGPLNVTGAIEASTSITAGTTVTATGNVAGGNITTGGAMEATGLISSGSTITATGNVSGGNLTTANAMDSATINTTGEATLASAIVSDLTSGRVVLAGTSGAIEDSANATFDGSTLGITGAITASTTVTATGNVVGGNLTTANAMDSATINTTGEATLASAIVSDLTSGRVVLAGTSGAIEDSANMTFDGSTLGITGAITASTTVTATGNVVGGNLTTAGQVAADNADITNGITAGTTITATGNVSGGNITTGGAVAATGLISSGTTITATGNVAGGNLTTGGDIDASGDIAGLTITSETFQGSNPTISSTGTDQNIILDPNGTGAVSVENAKITNLATPTADGDAANKSYVDSVAEGLDIKESCVAATTGALPAVTYNNGSSGVGATLTADANGALAAIDGVTLVADERVLVQNQAAALQNGIYVVTTVGDGSNPFVLTRAGDFDGSPASEIPGGFTFIEEGTTNADAGFVCTTNAPVTMGSTAINFTQFSGAGAITAGDGLSKTGDTLDVNVDDVTTAIVSDEVVVKTSANLTTPNIGVANGDSFTASGTVSATGNITGGNLTTGGDVTTVTVTASGAIAGSTTITATGNVAGGNLTTANAMDSATINTTGEATLASAIVSDLTSGRVVLAGTGGAIEDSGNFTFDGSTAAVTGAITASTTVTATGNVSGGNLTTAGAMDSATINTTGEATLASAIVSDLTSGRVVLAGTSGAIEDSGNFTFDGSTAAVTGAITASTTITATGNVAGGNITTGGAMEATGLISSGSTITATGNVAGGNITTGGRVDATGAVTGASLATGNITIGTDDITSAGEAITVNQDAQDVDFIVEGSSNANLLTIDAGTDTIVVGSASATTGATFKVDSTDSQMVPVGTTAQRPTGVTGMIRFNTTLDQFEFYDSDSWTTAGSDFTVIASETFSGDNSTVAFTLSTTQTTASCIVSINGVVQLPTTAYGVSGTTLTFTEAPLAGDVIEVREITTTSTIIGLASPDSSSTVDANDGGDVAVKGNIIPSANVTYDLGSDTERWNDLYLAGNSIVLGSVVIKNTGGNAIGFFGADGTTPGVIDANVEIAGDSIQNGTSLVDFSGTNGDVQLTAGGTQSLTVISTGANVAGDFATTGDVRFLDSDNSNYVGFQAPATVSSDLVWTLPSADAGVSGYALVSDGAGTLSFAAAGATVSADTSTDTDFLLYFASTTTGALTAVKQDSGLIYNPSSGLLSAAGFAGALTGNADTATTLETARDIGGVSFDGSASINLPGVNTSGNQDTSGTAAIATTVTVADESTDTTCFPLFATAATGDLGAKSGSNLTFNSSTGVLAATTFSGSGASLTSLNGSNISSGTIAAARVATLNQNTSGTAGGLSSAVTVSLTGAVTGSATFTSAGDTASITTTATSDPTITLAGDLSGSATLTNLGDATLTATIAANSVALGTDTTGNYVQQGATSGSGISGSVNSEGGTFTVTSNATNANTGSTIVFRDGSGNFSAGVITATATQARYADLAEMYAADGDIEAGTVVHFAGEGKLAACDEANHHAVAGIVSTDPAYLMNTDQEGVALAISGRVPCKVTGVVNAGDLMVSAGNGMAMANNSPAIGTVIGKAIESNAGGEAVIEVLAMMM